MRRNKLTLEEARAVALRGRHDLATARALADPFKKAWRAGAAYGRAAVAEDYGPFPYVMAHEPAAIKREAALMLADVATPDRRRRNPVDDYVAEYDDPGSVKLADDDAPPPEAWYRNPRRNDLPERLVYPRRRQVWLAHVPFSFNPASWDDAPDKGVLVSLVGVYSHEDALRFLEGFNGAEMNRPIRHSRAKPWAVIVDLEAHAKPGDTFDASQ